MPRQLGEKVTNILNLNDPMTGEKISLQYATPTTGQRINYSRELQVVKRKGSKVEIEDNVYKTRVKFGLEILNGFEEAKADSDTGSLSGGYADEAGNPISSDPTSKNYRSDWKELVRKYAADHLEFLARKAFEGVSENVDISFGEESGSTSSEGEDSDPLEK